ncbi:MAG: DUF2220 domain-containing protein, partial [Bdellovibrionaceae bacterium]|nr:DUF2220 domain-containing protein [Pseudobdellovibrionaceae bacterium]
ELVSVAEYRVVKEGWAKVSRPSILRIRAEDLVREYPHLVSLKSEMARLRSDFLHLAADQALRSSFKDMSADPSRARACFEVLDYLLGHRDEIKGLLPRQVQHSNSTKLIFNDNLLLRFFSTWRGECATWRQFCRFFGLTDKPIEFRFFAPLCRYQGAVLNRFHGVLSSAWADAYDFLGPLSAGGLVDGTLIVENLDTFHAEAERSDARLVIWGGGWKVAAIRDLHRSWPKPILYWGDMDKEGYEIYGHLKSLIPDLRPLLMDRETLERHAHLAIGKEPFLGPFRSAADLQDEYQYVCQKGLCVEQEKVRRN